MVAVAASRSITWIVEESEEHTVDIQQRLHRSICATHSSGLVIAA